MIDTGLSTRPQAAPSVHRIAALDLARSAALVAMAVFHFVFDLEMFGHIPQGTATTGGWRMLAIATAASFLFLAGVSLWLAHGHGIRWRGFWRRFALVAGAAALITLATRLAVPEAFIFFGILHVIAACSLLGLALLRVPALGLVALAIAVFWGQEALHSPIFDAPAFWWTGLQTVPIRSLDYVPMIPWMVPFLLGMAVGRMGERAGLWLRLAARPAAGWERRLGWPGRHSLAVYLIHQPVLISLIWAATMILP